MAHNQDDSNRVKYLGLNQRFEGKSPSFRICYDELSIGDDVQGSVKNKLMNWKIGLKKLYEKAAQWDRLKEA